MGFTGKVDPMRGQVSEAQQNALSVRFELQADCFADASTLYADAVRRILEHGGVEEALNAASQIGEDALQRGSAQQCNTFETRSLSRPREPRVRSGMSLAAGCCDRLGVDRYGRKTPLSRRAPCG